MKTSLVTTCLLIALAPLGQSAATRLKDMVSLEGVRENQLVGYGLVVGLNGTGDKRQTVFSAQSLTNLLARMGITVSPTAILVRNTAAVLVTADLPSFGQPGTRLDTTVSAIGDATNLQGGMLILTPLKAADGQVYAVAQGSVVTGGFVAGRGGATQTTNHPTAGRIPNGGIIERASPSIAPKGRLELQLHQPDFATAGRIAAVINKHFADNDTPVAQAENSALVTVRTPAAYRAKTVEFIGEVEDLTVDADRATKIIVNERTGTIVMGKDVQIAPVAILHGALTVEIQTTLTPTQPPPLSQEKTAVVPNTTVAAKEEKARNVVLKNGATVEELVRALTAIGSTPRDIIAILQSLKAAGALDGELEVI